MISKRKFYRTTIKVTVLSEVPFEWEGIHDVAYAITEGDCSGKVEETGSKSLTAKQVAKELKEQGSDPEFFQVNEDGEELSD